jgi:hypothetical protein
MDVEATALHAERQEYLISCRAPEISLAGVVQWQGTKDVFLSSEGRSETMSHPRRMNPKG